MVAVVAVLVEKLETTRVMTMTTTTTMRTLFVRCCIVGNICLPRTRMIDGTTKHKTHLLPGFRFRSSLWKWLQRNLPAFGLTSDGQQFKIQNFQVNNNNNVRAEISQFSLPLEG